MHTRIKYVFDGPIGISKQSYLIEGNRYARIRVDKANFTFEIRDSEGEIIVKGGNTKNYCVLLKQAKAALGKLGYEFIPEDRDRDYGLPSTKKQE